MATLDNLTIGRSLYDLSLEYIRLMDIHRLRVQLGLPSQKHSHKMLARLAEIIDKNMARHHALVQSAIRSQKLRSNAHRA